MGSERAPKLKEALPRRSPAKASTTSEPSVFSESTFAPRSGHLGGNAVAALAVAGHGGLPLPHLRRIQAAFGAHDLGDVRAVIGREGGVAARDMDARAFTIGERVAFGMEPDLRLAAHEAAHVVQQRHGVSVHDGAGDAGDRYEEQADAVADAVAGGRSAEPLLDTLGHGGWATPAIQRDEHERAVAELRGEAQKPEKPQAGSETETVDLMPYGKQVLSTSVPYMRRKVAEVVGERGWEQAEHFVTEAELHLGRAGEPRPQRRQRIAVVLRQQLTALRKAWTDFSAVVRNAAIARLKTNRLALADWTTYVSKLAPSSLMHQALAVQEYELMQSVAQGPRYRGPYDMRDLSEFRAWSPSPGRRRWVEALNEDRIHGGCMDCHVRKYADEYDRRFPVDSPAFIPPAIRLTRAGAAESELGERPAPSILGKPQPETMTTPQINQLAQGMPGLTAIAGAINDIRPRLLVLGDDGYRVLPTSVINSALTNDRLVAVVLQRIEDRRHGYLKLIGQVEDPNYDFTQLLPIVDTMLPSVDRDVQLMVRKAQERSAAARRARDTGRAALGVVAMLLTIFPPTAPLGLVLGATLAVGSIAQGVLDVQQGLMYSRGTGADVFSDEQVRSAGMLVGGGVLNIISGAIALLATAASVRQMLRPPPVGDLPYTFRMVSFDPKTGNATFVARYASGHMVTLDINLRTGTGTAFIAPNGVTIPVVNGQLRFPAGALPPGAPIPGPESGIVIVPTPPPVVSGPPVVQPPIPGSPFAPIVPAAPLMLQPAAPLAPFAPPMLTSPITLGPVVEPPPVVSPRPFALRGPNPRATSFVLEPAPGPTGTNYFGQPVLRYSGHIGSPLDPAMSAPPIYHPGPFTDAQRAAFLRGESAGTRLAPHHRHQLSTTQSGGMIDELPGPGHPAGNIHTTGPRHPGPSYFANQPGGEALRQAEIDAYWRAKGARLINAGPNQWIDPGP